MAYVLFKYGKNIADFTKLVQKANDEGKNINYITVMRENSII